MSPGEDTAAGDPGERASVASSEKRSWLVLEAVDRRGRRPLRPDAVLDAWLRGEEWPRRGAEVSGTTGTSTWEVRFEDGEGRISGEGVGVAYRVFERDADGVALLRLVGASTALINGEPFGGDVYGYGWATQLVPLVAGPNHVFVSGIRGGFQLRLLEAPGPISIGTWDLTLPDAVLDPDAMTDRDTRLLVGLPIFHADRERFGSLVVAAAVNGASVPVAQLGHARVAPLSQRKLPLAIDLAEPLGRVAVGQTLEVTVRVTVFYDEGPKDSREAACETILPLVVRGKHELQRRTFLSFQDLTVQEYCLRPPAPAPEENGTAGGEPDRLLLSLHGAGVHAWNQAASYPAQPGYWFVAATNRRPFGFDWQDWGRRDAYEALASALVDSGVSRRFVYLGGHSMGGHGTWHLGANDPDGFAALAPSAGWRSFDTYGGRPDTDLAWLWKQADAASDTEALLDNLVGLPTYILHGADDRNVPVGEAEAMFAALREAGAQPRMHIQGGAGHWWEAGLAPGADCLAWPGFFELFANTLIREAPREIEFTTVHPSVDSEHYWLQLLEFEVYGRAAHARGTWSPEERRIELEFDNVRRCALELPGWGSVEEVLVDGQKLPFPAPGQVLVRVEDSWRIETAPVRPTKRAKTFPGPARKTPLAGGPFKRAFDRNFLFVLPTQGGDEEQARALAVARYHQAVWRYRGNGDVPILLDRDLFGPDGKFNPVTLERNLILFGNEESNGAWHRVVRGLGGLRVFPGSVQVGERVFEGDDLTCLAVLPGQRHPDQLIGLIATTGTDAMALAPVQNLFVSGAGFPDYLVFGRDILTREDGGVRAAGWFDAEWQRQATNSYLRD